MIYLVRHGETEANVKKHFYGASNSPLTPRGIEQTGIVVSRLADRKIDIVYTSTLDRCSIIAQQLSQSTGAQIVVDDRINEMNFGVFENRTFYDIAKENHHHWQRWLQQDNYVIPEGESKDMVLARVESFVDDNIDILLTKNVVVVTHMGIVQRLLCRLLQMDREQVWRFRIANGAIVTLESSEEYIYMVIE